jgi:hypothetical protein
MNIIAETPTAKEIQADQPITISKEPSEAVRPDAIGSYK